MKPVRTTLLASIAIALAIPLMGQESCSTETGSESADESAIDSSNDGGSNDPDSPALPDPDGSYELTCDYLLGDFTEGSDAGYKFVAGRTIENTGNVGIVARLRVRWQQLGTEPVLEERTLRVKVGRTKRVDITRLATSGEIDAHQSANGDCSSAVKIVDTFGRVREG